EIPRVKAVADLMAQSAEADVRERSASCPAVNPVGEDALVAAAELARTGQHTTTADPDLEPECRDVLERELLRGELRGAVERARRLGRERLVDARGRETWNVRCDHGLEGLVAHRDVERGERRDGIDAAGAEQDEAGAPGPAELEHVQRAE